jgi:hypothetical protein
MGNSAPVSKIELISNIKSKVSTQEYFSDVRKLVFSKRIGSSFSEKFYKDELSLRLNDSGKISLDETVALAQEFDVPIFVNNFRNSNVLSFSLKNSENYFVAIQNSVVADRSKLMYQNLNQDSINKLLISAGFDPQKTKNYKNLTPVDLAKLIFGSAKTYLNQYGGGSDLLELNQFINKETSDLYVDLQNTSDGNTFWDPIQTNKKNRFLNQTSNGNTPSNTSVNPKFNLTQNQRNFLASTLQNSQYKTKPIIITTPEYKQTYFNIAVQSKLIDFGLSIKDEEIFPLAQFIILLNTSINSSNLGTIKLTAGISTPGQNFILGKLHEYQKKYAVELTIKTLPFFNLTDRRAIQRPAIFFSKRLNTLGANKSKDIELDFFSGEYRIVGFRHVITTTECYSEFLMIKYGTTAEGIEGN